MNDESGSVVARLYDGNHRRLRSIPAGNLLHGVNWDAIWFVRAC